MSVMSQLIVAFYDNSQVCFRRGMSDMRAVPEEIDLAKEERY